MKTTIGAAIALAMAMGTALAQGPLAPNTPFGIWQQEGAAGKPLTPTSELMRRAHNGEGLNGVPAPHGFAQNPPAQKNTAVPN
jgi:hypothetical protein